MQKINIIAIALLVIALGCLYPGVTKPMMNLSVGATLPLIGKMELYNQTQSIYQTIQTLFQSGNGLVGFLILLFSIIVPVIKAMLLFAVFVFKRWSQRDLAHKFVNIIAKWSMADVFVIGVFMAFLAGKANPNVNAILHEGFWWFTAYCVLSILGGQLIRIDTISGSVEDAANSENAENTMAKE